ncbi:MAG TPA: surface-adhesin E family protein [Burkholderiales bacterium]|nr:surface-adhesin E family protein [Burkholderiales bacterium]
MRLVLALSGLLLPGTGLAEWTPVAPDNGVYAAYADRATLRRDGPYATMLGLYDFPHGDFTPEGIRMFSTTVEREYDCREPRVRLLRYLDHAEPLGAGKVVTAAEGRRRWEAVVDGSLDLAYWKIACEGA